MLARAQTAFSPAFAPETLAGWFFDWARPDRQPKPTSVGLVHLVEGGHEGLFHEPWKPPGDEEAFSEHIDDVVRRIQHTALADVSVYDRPQRYAVTVYSGSIGINATPIATHKFLLQPPQGNSIVSDMTEGPTDKGALSLSMRLTEATTRTALMHAHSLLEAAQSDNHRLRERNAQLEGMLMQNIERYREGSEKQLRATEELINRKFEYDLKLQAAQSGDQAGREAWGVVKTVLPSMVEAATGGKVPATTAGSVLGLFGPAESPTPPGGELPLASLIRSITPEQQETLLKLLTDEQRVWLHTAAEREGKG